MTTDDVAVRATGLGKTYRIGEREPYKALRDVIAGSVSGLMPGHRRSRKASSPEGDEWFWALRDVDFAVAHGEALGIIGRNGAGKSTLLKILSRITEPSEGEVRISGRVGALLEVGTGFHPELTGRENVALNAAILGMRRAEIAEKFEAIVEFAGLERFMDTPVKRYSSGMQTRLAFAVAAHMEPEILIVDEVLAVGDAEFQKKCLGRMGETARSGRTVLFVSHNMAAVESLCDRAIWLDGGRAIADGAPADVISQYLATTFSPSNERRFGDDDPAAGNELVHVRAARVRREAGDPEEPMDVKTPFTIEFEYVNLRAGARLNLSLHVYNEQGIMVFNAVPTEEAIWQGREFPRGLFRDVCHVPADLLNDGVHTVELLVVEDSTRVIHRMDDVLVFEMRDVLEGREGWFGRWAGAVRPKLAWETECLTSDDELVDEVG